MVTLRPSKATSRVRVPFPAPFYRVCRNGNEAQKPSEDQFGLILKF